MPRSRGSEVVQKPTLRGSHKLRTSLSDSDPLHHRPITDRSPKLGDRRSPRGSQSDPLHHRPITDRSPKLGDRRSPRGSQSDPLNQKKLGTRLADLESQLGQAQDELKSLKEQLASAEAAKKEAQEKLNKKAKKPVVTSEPVKIRNTHPPSESEDSNRTDSCPSDDNSQRETDVFEVPAEKVKLEPEVEPSETDQAEEETKPIDISAEPPLVLEPEKSPFHDLALKNEEIDMLKAKLEEKEKEVEVFCEENESLKNPLKEAAANISSAEVKEKEIALKASKFEEELEASKANAARLSEKLKATEEAKDALEAEMKKMRVQTEQWKKAADAAAAILAGGVDMNGRISERCGSMDKHFGGVFEPPGGGYAGFVGSPAADDSDDGFGSGKRKGSGIKMFGDLWRKKGQK